MSHRLAGKRAIGSRMASAAAVELAMAGRFLRNAAVVGARVPADPAGRRVVLFEAEPGEVAAKRRSLPEDVIIEREILHSKPSHLPMEFQRMQRQAPTRTGPVSRPAARLRVTATGGQRPLGAADCVLLLQGAGRALQREDTTDAHGKAHFDFSPTFDPTVLAVVPAAGCWSLRLDAPSDPVAADCPPLPPAARWLGWWHRAMGIDRFDLRRGRGVGVGVIDTGLAKHPDLGAIEDVGAFLDGTHDPAGGRDVSNHGTFTCGLVGARPPDRERFGGMAPGARVLSARVFRSVADANQGDIASAIHFLAHDRLVDLINLSLGSAERSRILYDAIRDAFGHGALCICSAGNTGGPVSYPAAFPEAVAVAALGLIGWGPAGSLAESRLPRQAGRKGREGLYLANISAFGPEVDCAAPGVGIISTVPPRPGLTAPYLAMDGTSASSAAVSGALAAVLSTHPRYRSLPRGRSRAVLARRLLVEACRSTGLEARYEGRGLPRVARGRRSGARVGPSPPG
jgi:subtilisin